MYKLDRQNARRSRTKTCKKFKGYEYFRISRKEKGIPPRLEETFISQEAQRASSMRGTETKKAPRLTWQEAPGAAISAENNNRHDTNSSSRTKMILYRTGSHWHSRSKQTPWKVDDGGESSARRRSSVCRFPNNAGRFKRDSLLSSLNSGVVVEDTATHTKRREPPEWMLGRCKAPTCVFSLWF